LAYKITYKTSVSRDLKRLGKKESERVLDQIEQQLSLDPKNFPELKGRFAGLRKIRLGDYRVIFAILDDEVLVLRIGHRKEVYRGGR